MKKIDSDILIIIGALAFMIIYSFINNNLDKAMVGILGVSHLLLTIYFSHLIFNRILGVKILSIRAFISRILLLLGVIFIVSYALIFFQKKEIMAAFLISGTLVGFIVSVYLNAKKL